MLKEDHSGRNRWRMSSKEEMSNYVLQPHTQRYTDCPRMQQTPTREYQQIGQERSAPPGKEINNAPSECHVHLRRHSRLQEFIFDYIIKRWED
ncbi:hypothetical protein RB195_010221 [Necator americanus]